MALTPAQQELIRKSREEAGLSATAPSPAQAQNIQINRERAAKFNAEVEAARKSQSSAQRKASRTTVEKIADVTGGKEIAQGLGQALAMKGNTKRLEETQKQQIDLQGQLLQRIKEKKARGEDVSRLQGALDELMLDTEVTGDTAEREFLNPNELTKKQVIGDAVQLGATIAGTGALKGATKFVSGAKSVGGGIARGAAVGAGEGAVLGAVSGGAQAAQDDKSISEGAIKGGVTGAVGGAVLGGVAGGVGTKIVRGKQIKLDKTLDNITPKPTELSPKEYEKLVAQGRIAPKTMTSPAKYILSDAEKTTAIKYKNLIKKDPVKTSINITDEIVKQDEAVGNFLKRKNAIYNSGELKNSLKKSLAEITDITVPEGRLTKSKQVLVDNFINDLPKNDMETLWKARKAFDRKIESAFSGSPTLQKDLKIAFRNGVQDFISERTDDITYKAAMKEMSNLFKLRDTAGMKAAKERGLSALTKWTKENPIKAAIIGLGVSGFVGAKAATAGGGGSSE